MVNMQHYFAYLVIILAEKVAVLKQVHLNTLGNRLLFLRQSTQLTLQGLAKQTGLSSSNLSRYEKDEVKPTADAIVTLCTFYQVSTDWLLLGPRQIKAQPETPYTTPDSDLQKMIHILQQLMLGDNADLRGWTKIQFQKAFSEYYTATEEKKQPQTYSP